MSANREAPPRLAGLRERRIVLGVTGSVAAYKAVLVLRLLLKHRADVEVILTRSAEQFVGPETFGALTGKPVHTRMFGQSGGGELHVELATRADLLLIVPATADLLSRLALGRSDDLLAATALCTRAPTLLAPAMHPSMWAHPATRRNVEQLANDGQVSFVGPVAGEVASGEVGMGRMAEPEQIVAAVSSKLSTQDLSGRHLVISAGPTVEDIDPVRFLGNRSTGKMGFALAERAQARGAQVTLVTGPVSLPTPAGVSRSDVRSALEMRDALWRILGPDLSGADALIMSAAVGDYRPATRSETKLKRIEQGLALELVQNPDILAEIGQARKRGVPVLVGFAVEADEPARVLEYARKKLASKRVDLVVANHASDSFGRDDNRATLVSDEGSEPLPVLPKTELADRILTWLGERWARST